MRLLGPSALPLAALAVLLAGCGGNGRPSTSAEPTPAHLQRGRVTAAAYGRRLGDIDRKETAATNKVRKAAQQAKTVPQLRAALLAFANDQQRIGTDVGLILPPKKAAKANNLLARGFRDEAIELKALLPRLSKFKNPRQALAVIQRSKPKGGRELDQAVKELKKLGLSPSNAGG